MLGWPVDELGHHAENANITPTAMIIAAIITMIARAIPTAGDHGVEREDDVQREDLEHRRTEPAGLRSASLSSLLVGRVFDPFVQLGGRLVDEEQAAREQHQVASRERVVQHGEQRLGQAHQPRQREQQQDAQDQRQPMPQPCARAAAMRGPSPFCDRIATQQDVVDAEDDLHDRQADQADQPSAENSRVEVEHGRRKG
jgi:hypothetical protein